MPAYAAWLEETLSVAAHAGGSPWRFIQRQHGSIDPSRVIVVADHLPTMQKLRDCLGGLPALIVAPLTPAEPIPGVAYTTYRTATNPIEWGPEAFRVLATGADTVAFLLPSDEVHGQTLLHLWRSGVKRGLLFSNNTFRAIHPLLEAGRRKVHGILRKWAPRPRSALEDGEMTVADCQRFLAAIAPARPPCQTGTTGPLRIAHFICSLNSGGAERQVCNAALAQKQAGHDVRVLLRQAPVGADGYYLGLLQPHGIPARLAGAFWQDRFATAWRERGIPHRIMALLPTDLRRMVMDMAGELLAEPVDVLHCYVDDCNIVGLIAGLIARTPAIVLSMRNGNPTNFPGLLRPWMKPWYEATIGMEGIGLSSNSAAGARDYEHWLNLPPGAIGVIRNAFVPPPMPTVGEIARVRQEFNLTDGTPVIAGVFRLHPEKRPLRFVQLIARLNAELPHLRVLLAGVGVLERAVRKEIRRRGIQDVISLVGQRRDLPAILSASQVMLLVSDWEGTPNAVLESQYLGCVPVVTDAGGTAEAIIPGETGLLFAQNDLEEIAAGVLELLKNPVRRAAMARTGKDFVLAQFALKQAYMDTTALYRRLLDCNSGDQKIKLPPAA